MRDSELNLNEKANRDPKNMTTQENSLNISRPRVMTTRVADMLEGSEVRTDEKGEPHVSEYHEDGLPRAKGTPEVPLGSKLELTFVAWPEDWLAQSSSPIMGKMVCRRASGWSSDPPYRSQRHESYVPR